jgi:hypothetical protein
MSGLFWDFLERHPLLAAIMLLLGALFGGGAVVGYLYDR